MNGGHLLLIIIVWLVISLIRDNNKYNADGNRRTTSRGEGHTTRDKLVDDFRRQSNYAAARRAQQREKAEHPFCGPLGKKDNK